MLVDPDEGHRCPVIGDEVDGAQFLEPGLRVIVVGEDGGQGTTTSKTSVPCLGAAGRADEGHVPLERLRGDRLQLGPVEDVVTEAEPRHWDHRLSGVASVVPGALGRPRPAQPRRRGRAGR